MTWITEQLVEDRRRQLLESGRTASVHRPAMVRPRRRWSLDAALVRRQPCPAPPAIRSAS